QNLGALILKADHLTALGDARSAVSFYQHAIRVAPPAAEMPAVLRDELARAKLMCERYAGDFESFLLDRLASRGLPTGPAATRFTHSLDLLLGKKQRYFQQPNIYCFPELPQIQFYDRERFPWLDRVEAATPDIRAGLMPVLAETAPSFVPYVRHVPGRPQRDLAGLEENPSWSAFYMWKDGTIDLDNAAPCPKTLSALAEAPQVWVRNRS